MTEVRHGGGNGVGLNRECANCTPPCQGGEVLHRRGRCCHSYCECQGFEPVKAKSLIAALGSRLAKPTTRDRTWQ